MSHHVMCTLNILFYLKAYTSMFGQHFFKVGSKLFWGEQASINWSSALSLLY